MGINLPKSALEVNEFIISNFTDLQDVADFLNERKRISFGKDDLLFRFMESEINGFLQCVGDELCNYIRETNPPMHKESEWVVDENVFVNESFFNKNIAEIKKRKLNDMLKELIEI